MNLNQISNQQSNYQPTLIQQHNQSLQDNSVFSAVNYNQSQQNNQSNVLYNLNFNQLDQEIKQCSNILYDTDSSFHSNTTLNKTKLEHDDLNENVENGLETSKHKLNKSNSGSLGPKRQKKMKFSNEDSTEVVQSNSGYLYPNSNYYHKQSLVGSSSITSSNSSSTSSSPLSSSSPSHHHSQNQLNQNCLNSNISLSNQLSMPSTQGSSLLMNNNQKMTSLNNTHYSYADLSQTSIFAPYNHSDIRVGPAIDDLQNMKSYNDDLMENCIKNENNNNNYDLLDTSMEDFQRVKLKKSKKDPIVEYDTELAEAIEFELGLKKQNGPRKNSWGNLSYAELITRAIETSSDQRLTLSQIYDWIVKYVPYFKEKFDRTSSAGWKNSIRHNLSLHNRFIRVQNESSGKSSWWMINPDMSKYSLNTPIVSTNLMNPNNLNQLNSTNNSQHLDYTNSHSILPMSSENLLDQNQNPTLDNNLSIKTENLDSFDDLNQLSTIPSTESSENADGIIKKNGTDLNDNSTGSVISSEFVSSQSQDVASPSFDPLVKGPFHDSTKTNRNKNITKSKSSRSNKSLNQQSKSKSKMSKSSHISDAEVKSETNSNEIIKHSVGASTYSPSSPASTSSLKENDLLASNSMTSSISSMESNKLSQNLMFYNQNIGLQNSSGNNMQLMDSPSSLSSSSSSSIPYQNCSLATDSGNSILRAALQKSTITNGESPNSSSSNPSTPTPLQSAVPNTLLNQQTVNNSAQNNLMPFTDYSSQFYGGSSYQNNGQSFLFNQTNDTNLFSGSYPNYQSTYNPAHMNNKQSNQTFYNQNYTMQSAYNTNNERYFNQTSKASSQGSSLVTPSSSSSTTSSSSILPASASPNSSNLSTPNNYRTNSQLYSNYYIQMSQQSTTQSLMPSSNQTYQNSVFKGNQSQYSANIYDQNLPSLNQPIQYYDLNRNIPLQASESTLDSTASANEKPQTMLASMDCSNQANSHSGYDELNGFQDLLNNNNNDSSMNSINISNCNKSVGCYYN